MLNCSFAVMDYSGVIIVGAVLFSVLVVAIIVFLQAVVVVCAGVLNGLGIPALLVVGAGVLNGVGVAALLVVGIGTIIVFWQAVVGDDVLNIG